MIYFFESSISIIVAVNSALTISKDIQDRLSWAFGNARLIECGEIKGGFIGPRKEMITPWSTNAVEITKNMGIEGIVRIEEYFPTQSSKPIYDPMLQAVYTRLDQDIFTLNRTPEPVKLIDDISIYNKQEGLALSDDEINYLQTLSKKLDRKLTDSEIFGFSQVNSEHCRHKIFNGTFIIDGVEKESSLFQLIKNTTKTHPNRVISAYKDNCAFFQGPNILQFAPATQDKSDFFKLSNHESVISLKAETHNFPTTVEPFNGAATGTGGEIRDRIAGGKGALPIAGTAVYMTSYTRSEADRTWEKKLDVRKWLYQTPEEILIKASNGASDFGNKFGQPLICGSVLTFEHKSPAGNFGFDKVIMLAGGIGFGRKADCLKDEPKKGDKVVLLGGDNYRIGMGGGAVSSVATGEYNNTIELNAVQRSNPEMQKRAYNAIRALSEADVNPIISIHDHGAGGHLNCLSELVEKTGGRIDIDKLPIGDPTLSAREIVGNESQERMGLVIEEKHLPLLKAIAERERAPMYVIGETTGDMRFTFKNNINGETPIDLDLDDFFGNPPKMIMRDDTVNHKYNAIEYDNNKFNEYITSVLQIESVACKDYLTNKVDRSVTGRIAKQQCAGTIQLPLNNLAVVALDYTGTCGIATSLGHAPIAGMIDPAAGSLLSIAESLTNIIWTPLEGGLKGVSLSANWMWPCKNKGEDARLYNAVQAASDFAIALGINIPTGKDSLSMTQKYKDGALVYAPGTVIISAAAEAKNIRNVIEPVLSVDTNTELFYINMSSDNLKLGGSAFAQILNMIGDEAPTVKNADYFATAFNTIQQLIEDGLIISGHDVSSGGLITTLLEMNFANVHGGLQVRLDEFADNDIIKILFNENPALVIQVKKGGDAEKILTKNNIRFLRIAEIIEDRFIKLSSGENKWTIDVNAMRDTWFHTSFLLDRKQSGEKKALERYTNYKNQALNFVFPANSKSQFTENGIDPSRQKKSGIKAAIIREKGVNGDREMAWSLYLAGFDVKDVHMTDLISGREDLSDIQMIVFVGGFSNSDVLGSAKGWAGAFLYNEKAKNALDTFYARKDTLSLGVCNGCQLMIELGLVSPDHTKKPVMKHNESHKFESAFLTVRIPENKSIMLSTLAGSKLGIWIAHGEGKFSLPYPEDKYNVALKYSYNEYPANPNGSNFDVAGLVSADGRHLAMMPHLERSIYPWNWAHYPSERLNDEVTPWIEAFVNARKWLADSTI